MDWGEVTVLCVDDDSSLVDLTAEFLERERDEFTVLTETDPIDGLDRLDEGDIDCIVSDYEMPHMDGLEFLRAVRENHSNLPFILFTGRGSESVAEDAIRAGVTDYLQKGGGTSQYAVLANRIENAVNQYLVEQRADCIQQEYELVAETATDTFWTADLLTDTVSISDGIEQFGYNPSSDYDIDWFFEKLHPDDRDRTQQLYDALFAREAEAFDELNDDQGTYSNEYWFQRADGTYAYVESRGVLLFESGEPVKAIGTMTDITEQKEREQERGHYHTLAQTTKDVIVRIDSKSVIQDVNPAVSKVFGYEADELVGESLATLMSADMAENHSQALQRYLRTGEHQLDWDYIELTGVHADGTEIPISVSFSEYEHNGDHYFTGIIRDVSQQKEREQELKRTNNQIEAILETIPSAAYLLTLDGEVSVLNKYARELLGLENEQVENRPITDLVPNDLAKQFLEDHRKAVEADGVVKIEEQVPSGDEVLTFHTLIGPVYDEDGEVYATCGISTDVSSQKAREQELVRKTERLDKFAEVLSHDLRNPVRTADGYLELAQEECDTPHLDKVDDALARADSIIEDVLTLARGGETVSTAEEVSLCTVAEKAWRGVEQETATLKVTEMEEKLACDPDRVCRAFENLFRNAIEHGGNSVTVRVGPLAGGDGFYIEDDGPGVSAVSDELFEWGYSMNGSGTGFGLAIVEQIVEAHGWTISATDGDAGGARFEIRRGESY